MVSPRFSEADQTNTFYISNADWDISLEVLVSGNIVVAILVTGHIKEFSSTGEVVRAVKIIDGHPANICFGGADMRTAYYAIRNGATRQWPEPGLKLTLG
jgi:gluconolactonase